ncbi:MAG: DUF4160 domain-containing protein [Planctomycetaceae bacterium]|nr:DUF4160 domain-containing protein [Planctomycetaceae bacterium]
MPHHDPYLNLNDEDLDSVPRGSLLAGDLPSKKLRMVRTWIDIHADELMACWNLAVNGSDPPTIDPLR